MEKQFYLFPFIRVLKNSPPRTWGRPLWSLTASLLFAAGLALMPPAALQGQSVLWSDDFEDTGSPSSGMRAPDLENGSGDAYFGRAEDSGTNTLAVNSNTVNFSDYSGESGTWFWAGENHDNISGNSQAELEIVWNGIDITGYSNIQFLGLFGADDGGDFESDNQLYVEYRLDGSGPWLQGLRIEANDDDDWAVDTDNDGDGDGPVLTENFQQLAFNISGTGTSLELRVRVNVNGSDEEWAIDNFRLQGCTVVPTITMGGNPTVCQGTTSASLSYSATTGSPDQYSIDFDGAANAAGFADVSNASLPASPIAITVPGAVEAGVYNGVLTVNNSSAPCPSAGYPISVTVQESPTFDVTATPAAIACGQSAVLAVENIVGPTTSQSFSNTASISIPASGSSGDADPYPSSITVSGLPASSVTVASVQLSGLSHTDPDDLDIYLAGPNSQYIWLMSDAGGNGDISNFQLAFQDGGVSLPNNSNLSNNTTYAPGNFSGGDPSPSGTQLSGLSGFSGNPNGSWSLYIYDDNSGDVGSLSDGWSITFNVPIAYNYAWSNGPTTSSQTVEPAMTTVYSVSVTDPSTLCFGTGSVTVTVTEDPGLTITLGTGPSVCQGVTSASLPYSATSGSPDLYSIDFDAAANAAGFADVLFDALPASPITISVPGAVAAGVYNATLTLTNSSTSCSSVGYPITVTVGTAPTFDVNATPDDISCGQSSLLEVANLSQSSGTQLQSFNNTTPISIPATGSSGNANPYPSTIAVSGLPASGVTVARVQLNGLTHTNPDDLDIFLVGPNSQSLWLMSDAGGGGDISNFQLGFEDGGAALPNSSNLINNTTYAPQNFGTPDGATPPATLISAFSGFTGNPNGNWSLYIFDDDSGDAGSLSGGWSITFEAPLAFTFAWSNGPATASQTVSPSATTTYSVTVTDPASSCFNTKSVTVTVSDNVNPGISCPTNITIGNDAGQCSAVVSFAAPVGTDNCPNPTTAQTAGLASGAAFPVGTTTNTFVVTDGSGNSASCSFTVTVQDNTPPTALCQNVTVQLNAGGTASVTAAQVNNGSSDNCGIASLSVAPNAFTCANVGGNNVTLTVTDVNGNSNTCSATVTVQDNVAPTALCRNATVQIDGGGNASVTAAQVNNGSSDNCGIASLSVAPNSFTCANIGANNVTLTVTDVNGNSSTCTATVTVQDATPPTAFCQNITVQLNTAGAVSVVGEQVNSGSYDNCAIGSFTLSPNAFSCSDVGPRPVTLTVTDVNGNSSTCTATVTVEDIIPPQGSILNSFTANYYDGTEFNTFQASDNVPYINFNWGKGSPYPALLGIDLFSIRYQGATTVPVTGSYTFHVTTDDGVRLYVDNQLIIDQWGPQIGSFSATASLAAGSPIPVVLEWNEYGDNALVKLEWESADAGISRRVFVPQLVDVCQDITVQLNASGQATITAGDIDPGFTDNCGIASLSVAPNSFTCANIGPNNVTLTVTDVNSNSSSCTATVTVQDNVAPTALCQNVTVQLNAGGTASVTAAQVNNGSSDNCGIASLSVAPNSFTCANVGPNTVTLTVTDVNGNSSSCTATVTVQDIVAPTALCQNVTVQLNAGGTASVTAAQVNNGSSDNCGIASLSVAPNSFTCASIGPSNVTLTVTDVGGNSATCSATVTVQDNSAPTALCQNVTVQLNAGGTASVTAAQVNNGSSDNCGIASLSVAPNSFTCANIGGNNVTLTVTDVNGNSSSCSATVTVQDNSAPTALCQNVTVQLNAGGTASVTAAQVNNGSSDNCGIASLSVAPNSFTCANVGPNPVTLTVADVNGNSSTCSATVTVQDNTIPTAQCQNVTVQLNAGGTASVTAAQVNNGSSDACGIASLSVAPNSFTCANVGPNPVTLTVADANGNSSSCSATVTVQDNIAPTALCQNVTIQLDAAGEGSVKVADIDGGSSDACGIQSAELSQQYFYCEDLGANPISLTVTDANGNSSSCGAIVTVEDLIAPVAVCLNATVYLSPEGTYTLDASEVLDFANSYDNCGFSVSSIAPSAFDCGDVGEVQTVIVSIQDASGNFASCNAMVEVQAGAALPEPWISSDIGSQGGGSSYAYNPCSGGAGTFTITTGANNSVPASDNLGFINRELCGDFQITVRVQSVTPTGYAGLLVREDNTPGSRMLGEYSNLSNLLRWEARLVANGPKTFNIFNAPLPYWLRIVRQGNWFYGYYSFNGSTFFLITAQNLPLGTCVRAGMGAFTNITGMPVTAVFSDVSVQGGLLPLVNLPDSEAQPAPAGKEPLQLKLYPNPARDLVTLEIIRNASSRQDAESTARLRNQQGQVLEVRKLDGEARQLEWDINGLPSGLYFIEVMAEGEAPQFVRFIKAE